MTHQISQENWRNAEKIVMFILDENGPSKAKSIMHYLKKHDYKPCARFAWSIRRVVYVLKRLRSNFLAEFEPNAKKGEAGMWRAIH